MNTLGILVPAYKEGHLRAALRSIAAQDRNDFDTYIFDDHAGPGIAEASHDFPSFKYHRFLSNLGSVDLCAHLNRCLQMVPNELVWVFSDDDLMSQDCVTGLLETASRYDADVYAFEKEVIDASGRVIKARDSLPDCESAGSFLVSRMLGGRNSFLPDHAFRRNALLSAAGGIVPFPLAWNSDDATWILLAQRAGIRRVARGAVSWRLSGENLSSQISNHAEKWRADQLFVEWLFRHGLMRDHELNTAVAEGIAYRAAYLYRYGWRHLFQVGAFGRNTSMPPSFRARQLWAFTRRAFHRGLDECRSRITSAHC